MLRLHIHQYEFRKVIWIGFEPMQHRSQTHSYMGNQFSFEQRWLTYKHLKLDFHIQSEERELGKVNMTRVVCGALMFLHLIFTFIFKSVDLSSEPPIQNDPSYLITSLILPEISETPTSKFYTTKVNRKLELCITPSPNSSLTKSSINSSNQIIF